jgi:hypothetical protein
MRRQTLRKPCSSTRHHHRSSTLTNAIQMRQKNTPSYCCCCCCCSLSLSLSLSLSRFFLFSRSRMLMILNTQLQKGRHYGNQNDSRQSSAMKRERGRASEASSLCERPREGGARRREPRTASSCLRSPVTVAGVRRGVGGERARKWGSDKTKQGTICSQVGVPKWVNNRPLKVGHANRYRFLSNWN